MAARKSVSRKSGDAAPKPQIRIMFRKAIAMGPGKADLLEAIEQTGSISAAARKMRMSYRRAWLLVDTMNQCFAKPLVATATGGSHGGGAQITEFGREVLRRYREMDSAASAAVARQVTEFTRLMSRSPQ